MFPSKIIMFDSVTLSTIPSGAKAVAGYVNGAWPTFPKVVTEFPHSEHLSISISARGDAETLDIENGDARPNEAPRWVKIQLKRGVKRPVVYCEASKMLLVRNELLNAGIPRRKFRLWSAHWTDVPHICSKECGFGNFKADATQYTSNGFGRNLDISLCRPNFFGSPIVKTIKRIKPMSWLRFGHI